MGSTFHRTDAASPENGRPHRINSGARSAGISFRPHPVGALPDVVAGAQDGPSGALVGPFAFEEQDAAAEAALKSLVAAAVTASPAGPAVARPSGAAVRRGGTPVAGAAPPAEAAPGAAPNRAR